MKFLIFIAFLLSSLTSLCETPSPLASFSPQWNYPMFEKANTAAVANYLNKEEKDTNTKKINL